MLTYDTILLSKKKVGPPFYSFFIHHANLFSVDRPRVNFVNTGCFYLMIRFLLLPVGVILKISTCKFLQIVEEE